MKRPFDFVKLRLLMEEFDGYARPFEAVVVEREKKFIVERASPYGGKVLLGSFSTQQEADGFKQRWEGRFPEIEATLLKWFAVSHAAIGETKP